MDGQTVAAAQMCCEHMECFVAVFVEAEATCYLKGPGALHTYDFKSEDGTNSHEMLFREGALLVNFM